MTQARNSVFAPLAGGRRARSKVVVGLLACLFGGLGAHWWYLGRRHAWAVTVASLVCLVVAFRYYPVWYDNPAFFLLLIPMVDGFIESVVFSLMSDEKFDRFYNPGAGRPSDTGWGPVLVALFSGLVGSVITMFGIAMVVMYVSIASGWLDGYTF